MNSATLPSFWSAYARLDESVKRSARKTYQRFDVAPAQDELQW